MLVPELRQHAAVGATEKYRPRITHYDQRVAVAEVAGVGRGTGIGPEAVVEVTLLEIGKRLPGVRQVRFGRAGACHQPKLDEVVAGELAWVVQC